MKSVERLLRWFAFGLLALMGPALALAEDDPSGRVGRIAEMQGDVTLFDADRGEWVPAQRNRPLTGGDRISTDTDARAELRIGSTTVRLAGGTELEVLRLDDERVKLQLHDGSLALRVRSREVAAETEIVTAEARLHPLRGGHYRIDRIDDSTYAASWRGELRVEDRDDPFTIDSNRRAEIWREGRDRVLRQSWTSIPDDAFSDWVAREDRRDERSAANRYVSPEMTGAEDLDRYGRWEQHPDYGALWVPAEVDSGWAPYRYGHWAWVAPWGWTWVDDAPWGFAPFHYGRWVSWGGRWCWSPGTYVARPVYAPALVAWVGGANFSVSVSVGGPVMPAVGWVPLAPREVFVPYYRHTPVYIDRVNVRLPGRPQPQVPTGPVMYSNQGVPGAVSVVPRDVLEHRQPVARAVIDLHDSMRRPLPVLRVAPAPAPAPRVVEAPQFRAVPGEPLRALHPRPGAPVVVPVPGGVQPSPQQRHEGPRDDRGASPAIIDLRQPPRERTTPDVPGPDRAQRERAVQEPGGLNRPGPDKAAQDRAAFERAAQDKAARDKAAQERAMQEVRAAQERRAAQDRVAQERVAQERAALEKAAQDKAAQDKAAQDRAARERQQHERAVAQPAPAAAPAPAVAPAPAPAAPPRPKAPEQGDGKQHVPEQRNSPREREELR